MTDRQIDGMFRCATVTDKQIAWTDFGVIRIPYQLCQVDLIYFEEIVLYIS